jgi:hypothetical protein
MSDITGDAFTIHAAKKLEKAIEHVGYTSSQQQVGKGISANIADDDTIGTGYNARGARFCKTGDTKVEFLGVVKAVTSEAQGEFARTKTLGNPVTGANPTYAPYFLGDVTVLEGQALTVERNCITYVLAKAGEEIEFGDLIKCDDKGLFAKADSAAEAVGRAYSNQADNKYDVIRAYIEAI